MYRRGALLLGVLVAVLLAGAVAWRLLAPEPSAAPTIEDAHVEWTGPVRQVGGLGAVVMLEAGGDGRMTWSEAPDAAPRWADVARVSVTREFQNWGLKLGADPPLRDALAREDHVLAFGFVMDTTGDGVADYVVGIDTDAAAPAVHVWLTDLASGETRERFSGPYGDPFDFATSLEIEGDAMAGDRPPGGSFFNVGAAPAELFDLDHAQFYAWSSLTVAGEVVAWDYAPDAGWLRAPARERLGCTPLACPMTGPAPGPGARAWIVTVENQSADETHLFVAADRSPMGELVGTATPASVAAGVTQQVVFTVPAGSGWAIFVNPSPGMGPLILAQDVPPDAAGALPIRIIVQPGGAPSVMSRGFAPGWFGD
ncbi:MAG TPA: hypothetical protein VMP86_05705 [Candidatus Binatia bacterium]|nr:hypothetical protein [Candidatus Binatia bacterium]